MRTIACALLLCLAARSAWAEEPGFLGVSMEERAVLGSEPARAEVGVAGVVPGSAAEQAGLEPGDILVSLDGQDLGGTPGQVLLEFSAKIRGRGVGAVLRLVVRRWTLEVRESVDEVETRRESASEAEGGALLPDLGQRLREHPDASVGARVRRYARERELEVVLGARPNARVTALPANETLRPALAQGPPGLEQRFARRLVGLGVAPITSAYQDLLQRFEADEGIEDAFRLETVRFLRRDPLWLPDATRRLGETLRAALESERPDRRLLPLAAATLDVRTSVAPLTSLRAPAPGSSPEAHGRYLLGLVREAGRLADSAFAALSAEERAHLVVSLPEIAEVFGAGKYLHTDEDRARYKRTLRSIQLLAKVERGPLLQAQATLMVASDRTYLRALEADLLAAELRGHGPPTEGVSEETLWSLGTEVVIGSSRNNIYAADFEVVVDLGGDDTYLAPAAAARPGRPAALLIDLSGDDRYQATAPFSQGSAFMGAALLLDVSGDDSYASAADFAQGAALAGSAICWDLAGRDVYRGQRYAQGAALCQGLGALIDSDGDDRCEAAVYSQGFAGPGAFGALLAHGGNDHYGVTGRAPSGYGTPGAFRSMGQGASFGFRHLASGGVAVLCDLDGDDTYEAGNFAQGGGYYFGWGLLCDLGQGRDRYAGSRYAQGWAAHSALGSLWDEGGDDRYAAMIGASTSAAWDLCATVLLEDGGDDRYFGLANLCNGASAQNGLALLFDAGGRDYYRLTPGKAGPNNYHEGHSLALFVDTLSEGDAYRYEFSEERALVEGAAGIRIDTSRSLEALEALSDAELRALLGAP